MHGLKARPRNREASRPIFRGFNDTLIPNEGHRLSMGAEGGPVRVPIRGPVRRVDKMNVRILNLLQRDAKMTTAEIARRLNRAESTVRERIYAMERAGVIRGYCAIVDKRALGYESEALVFCNVPPANMEATVHKIAEMKNVTGVLLVSGDRRYVIRVAAPTNRELRDFVHKRLIPMDITDVETRIVMDYVEKLPPEGVVDEDLG